MESVLYYIKLGGQVWRAYPPMLFSLPMQEVSPILSSFILFSRTIFFFAYNILIA